jgi:hypothetical protein
MPATAVLLAGLDPAGAPVIILFMDGPRHGPAEGGEVDSPSPAKTIEALLSCYEHIADKVRAEVSATAGMIRAGEAAVAGARLRAEIDEALRAARGDHSHDPAKTRAASSLLRERGLDPGLADLLLETEQIGYWYLVGELAAGRRPAADQIVGALAEGEGSPLAAEALASAALSKPQTATVFALVGRLLANAGLPAGLFAELDLREMRGKPYLEDVFRGL